VVRVAEVKAAVVWEAAATAVVAPEEVG